MIARSIMTISLLAALLLVACAPAASSTPAQAGATLQPAPQETVSLVPLPTTPTEIQPKSIPTEVPPTEAPPEVPQIVATSRGPNLEATDPATVSLASGGLQLVEFFRFT